MANKQSLARLGPKPRAWATSVLGNLERLTKDQSIAEETRNQLWEIEKLLEEIFAGTFEGKENLSLKLVLDSNSSRKKTRTIKGKFQK